ncbi:MAG: hypothetical protein H0W89_07935 [Candidatus Levybacteria bacterium]|nr:hypothetical protein [Candidatus Levybacteria bacterium]
MTTLRQLKEELPLINRIHIKQPRLRKLLHVEDRIIPADVTGTTAYIQKNTVLAQEGRKCVDGRYPPHTASGMLARAGGDCGYVMALLAINKKKNLGMTPEQCLNAVYKVICQKLHGSFCMHTDHHVDPEHEEVNHKMHQNLIGCGHLAKASSQLIRERYDVHNEDVKKVIAYARNLSEISSDVDMVNLDGEHKEQGVLLIESDTYTVNAMDAARESMYFIYDKTRDEAFMKKLVREMNVPEVTFEDMKEESDVQLQATLHNLAKGLPLYHVSFEGKKPAVTFVTHIQ